MATLTGARTGAGGTQHCPRLAPSLKLKLHCMPPTTMVEWIQDPPQDMVVFDESCLASRSPFRRLARRMQKKSASESLDRVELGRHLPWVFILPVHSCEPLASLRRRLYLLPPF